MTACSIEGLGAVYPSFPSGSVQEQLDELRNEYQHYLNTNEILPGEPNDSLKVQIEAKIAFIQDLINEDPNNPLIENALNDLYALMYGDEQMGTTGLQLSSEKLALLEEFYGEVSKEPLDSSSLNVAYSYYNALKQLLEGEGTLNAVNSKLSEFQNLKNDWIAESHRNTQAQTHSIALKVKLAEAKNRYKLLEIEQKAQERLIEATDNEQLSRLREKGVMGNTMPTPEEIFEKQKAYDARTLDDKNTENSQLPTSPLNPAIEQKKLH